LKYTKQNANYDIFKRILITNKNKFICKWSLFSKNNFRLIILNKLLQIYYSIFINNLLII
jgi:hypothetical protein